MSKEDIYVVRPLIKWFEEQQPDWKIYKPNYPIAATGWDIEASRKNQDLLIEAKYINGPFLSSFGGLVTAPLANRKQRSVKKKYRSWSYGVCWAIGGSYKSRSVYQIMFDYFARNMKFWEAYGKILHMKYIFFVEKKQVQRITWRKFLSLAEEYGNLVDPHSTKLKKRREVARFLIEKRMTRK